MNSSTFSAATDAVIKDLFAWYEQNGRHSLPWRQTKDPYRILVSELMLQQTQVSRVIPKYNAFLKSYPTLKHLAKAQRAEVLQHWQGLGYNNRAIRFHTLAKAVSKLPDSRDELLKLPGIGPYTAGAIMIFAHNAPDLSVDVNVERVLKRVFWPPEVMPARKDVDVLALNIITQSKAPHAWHCAIMDLGSAICTARAPKCMTCPLLKHCKTRGVRPEELKTPKQSKFLGSTRWWRGQILKAVLKGPVPAQHLMHKIKETPDAQDQDRYEQAIAAMLSEGIIIRENKRFRLA
jgi:A/G-specific adenine glycosylase